MKKEKIGFKNSVSIFVKALFLSVKVKSPFSLIWSVLGFGMAFWAVIISKQLQSLTDGIVALSSGTDTDVKNVVILLAVLIAMYIWQAVFITTGNHLNSVDAYRTVVYIKDKIIKRACRLKYKYIENDKDFRQKISYIQTDAGYRTLESIQSIISILQGIITFASVAVVLWAIDFRLVIILFSACLPGAIVANKFSQDEYRGKTVWMTESVHVMNLFSNLFRPFKMKEVRYFGLFDYLKDIWRQKADNYRSMKFKLRRKYLVYNCLTDLLRNGVFIGVLLITVNKIFADPAIGLGMFMLVFNLSVQFQDVVTNISVKTMRLGEDIPYMRDFFDIDKLENENYDKNAKEFDSMDIEFKNVSFKYPGSALNAINNLSVIIKQGEKIAIVGKNGSGKSTFVNMLMGYYEPDNGEILANGNNVQDILTRVRRSISVVFQEFCKYDNTIKENICVSDRRKTASQEELDKISKLTGAYDFIKDELAGFDEIIGNFSPSGNNLSGGQWQRLALTRALYRDKARMMILDEPTAALDPVAEAQLYRDFAALTGDKTTILISHRLGITSVVDRILVFDNGKIIEDGSHDELLAAGGEYSKMYQSQAQWYKN